MKLKFIDTNAKSKLFCTIGKTGQIRFKKNHVEKFDLKANSIYYIGYDEDENPIKNLYLVPSVTNNGFKLYSQNGGYFIQSKKVVEELKLTTPIICKISILETKDKNLENSLRLSFML